MSFVIIHLDLIVVEDYNAFINAIRYLVISNARFEVRLKARWHQNSPKCLPKDVGHGRHTPSYPRLFRGVKAYAFFASWEEAYASRGKRPRVEGSLREKEEKEERPEEKENKERKRKIAERLEAGEEERR